MNHPERATKARALLAATHFPQALAMVLLMTISTAICGGTWWSVVLVLLASAAGQATVGWTNDMHDSQADRAAGRANKPRVRGEVRAEELRVPILVSASLTIPLSLLASGWIGGGAHIAAVASALNLRFIARRVQNQKTPTRGVY
jgi:4-hydroxybenzoate polyprenyltransferase